MHVLACCEFQVHCLALDTTAKYIPLHDYDVSRPTALSIHEYEVSGEDFEPPYCIAGDVFHSYLWFIITAESPQMSK